MVSEYAGRFWNISSDVEAFEAVSVLAPPADLDYRMSHLPPFRSKHAEPSSRVAY